MRAQKTNSSKPGGRLRIPCSPSNHPLRRHQDGSVHLRDCPRFNDGGARCTCDDPAGDTISSTGQVQHAQWTLQLLSSSDREVMQPKLEALSTLSHEQWQVVRVMLEQKPQASRRAFLDGFIDGYLDVLEGSPEAASVPIRPS